MKSNSADSPKDTTSFTCPNCGLTSYNPNDVENSYCGNCHEITDWRFEMQTVFHLDDEQWDRFMAILDAPPKPIPRLMRLLQEPSILERNTHGESDLKDEGQGEPVRGSEDSPN